MTDTPRRHSTREVRRSIWQVLRRHALPILLALLILSLPVIAAGVLDGLADTYRLQLRAEKAQLWEQAQAPGWSEDPANQDLVWNALMRESELESRADLFGIIAALLILVGRFFALPLLFGVNLVLITILRGGEFRWRDAGLTFAEFRRGFKLQCYILVLMLILEVPGVLIGIVSGILGGGGVARFLDIAATLVTFALTSIAALRFQLAPRLLADGDEGTSSELVDRSCEILDNRTLLPQLSILFPGLLMVLSARLLHVFVLQEFLPLAAAGALQALLSLPGYAYLLTGSAAIYTTFRTE